MNWRDEFRANDGADDRDFRDDDRDDNDGPIAPEPLTAVVAHPTADTARTVAIFLREEGFTVTTTDDTSEAYAGLAEEPDLFVVDSRLPDFDLRSLSRLLRTIRSEDGHLNTIIVVLAQESEIKKLGDREGLSPFITPFNPLRLGTHIRQAFRRRTRR